MMADDSGNEDSWLYGESNTDSQDPLPNENDEQVKEAENENKEEPEEDKEESQTDPVDEVIFSYFTRISILSNKIASSQ